MKDDRDANVIGFPKRHKGEADPGKTLEVVTTGKCYHERFIIDEAKPEVECAVCHERLDPLFVLRRLASVDSKFQRARERYKEEMKRLDARQRTKCRNCGKITPISRD